MDIPWFLPVKNWEKVQTTCSFEEIATKISLLKQIPGAHQCQKEFILSSQFLALVAIFTVYLFSIHVLRPRLTTFLAFWQGSKVERTPATLTHKAKTQSVDIAKENES
jgi:hypothetical protein